MAQVESPLIIVNEFAANFSCCIIILVDLFKIATPVVLFNFVAINFWFEIIADPQAVFVLFMFIFIK